MPEVIVIDEIGTELEAQAARTIAERGVQLVGTAHGNTLENLMANPTLSDLVGGIQSVTLGDEEARRRGTQKSILERKAPPTFQVVVEIQNWDRVRDPPRRRRDRGLDPARLPHAAGDARADGRRRSTPASAPPKCAAETPSNRRRPHDREPRLRAGDAAAPTPAAAPAPKRGSSASTPSASRASACCRRCATPAPAPRLRAAGGRRRRPHRPQLLPPQAPGPARGGGARHPDLRAQEQHAAADAAGAARRCRATAVGAATRCWTR